MTSTTDVAPYAGGALVPIAQAGLEPFISALEGEDTSAWTIVSGVNDPKSRVTTVDRLIRLMAVKEEMRGVAAEALRNIGEPALDPLINALQDKDVRMRRAAVMPMQWVLPAVKDPEIRARAVEPLIRAMKDADGEVRVYAPAALGKIGEPAVEPLLRVILEQNTPEHVGGAASSLGLILGASKGRELGRRIVQPLIAALKADSPELRQQAAAALEQISSMPESKKAIRNAG